MTPTMDQFEPSGNRGRRIKVAVLLFLVGVITTSYILFGDDLTLAIVARKEVQLRAFQQQHPLLVYGAAFLAYVVITGLSLPGAAILTLVYGWYFGLVRGVIVVSFASTSGATVAFLLSRFLFRDAIDHRFGDRLESFNKSLAREGPFFLFTLRLIPAVPFFVINAAMGLTPIRTRTFWWVSQLGMFPATVVYTYAGSSVPSLQTLAEKGVNAVFTPSQMIQIVIAFALLGLFPLVVRWTMKMFTANEPGAPESTWRRGGNQSSRHAPRDER